MLREGFAIYLEAEASEDAEYTALTSHLRRRKTGQANERHPKPSTTIR